MIWSFILAAVGLLGLYLTGQKRIEGWAVGVGAQVLWLAYAVVTRQWGFIITAVAYALMFGRNWYVWARAAREERTA